ncbi:RNA 2',3'-cyclic phosphodiesterase [Dyadobacter crusticola]|uniref:RNA 2',3'-cyclic phosphodiesterase n=1 Tax=Dyadobacter crusticola TaxID=292407 RepID=UPI0004E20054|nr:RNA 2',3'-cyclic phosphodiesterase [Dyadobacter crusticola]
MAANRLFIGIPVPVDIARRLQEQLPAGDLLKRSAPENYHITLQFLGEVHDVESVIRRFEKLTFKSFGISINGISGFYKNDKLSVLYLSILNGKSELGELSQLVKTAFPDYDKDTNPVFTPHITVNRNIKKAELPIAQQLLTFRFAEPISFGAMQIFLYDSSNFSNSRLYKCIGSVDAAVTDS